MKKTAKLCVAVISLSALTGMTYAATPGAYMGLGLGGSKQETPTKVVDDLGGTDLSQSHKIGGLGGRVFGGYNFNQYFGIEAGVAQYAQSNVKFNVNNVMYNGVLIKNLNGSVNYKMTAFDLVGKAYLPISDSGFNVYGLGGVALVHSQVQEKANASGQVFGQTVVGSGDESQTQNKLRPIVGVGASYAIPQTQLTTSFEYSHIIGKGDVETSSSAIPSADLVTLNLAYNFG